MSYRRVCECTASSLFWYAIMTRLFLFHILPYCFFFLKFAVGEMNYNIVVISSLAVNKLSVSYSQGSCSLLLLN